MRGLILGSVAGSGATAGFIPNDFTLTDETDVEQGITETSAGVQITAATPGGPCAISISGGEYQTADDSGFTTNASAWSSSPGLISENQYVRVRLTTATNWSTGASCTLTIGEPGQTQDDTFNTTTRASITVFLTSGSGSWSKPSGWYDGNNTVDCIGGGGGGRFNTIGGGPGGGGGAFSRETNIALGVSAQYSVGAGGIPTTQTANCPGGDTWFNGASLAASSVGAKGGTSTYDGNNNIATNPGGDAASGVGSLKFSGGTGGSIGPTVSGRPGGGGGAAAGAFGAGGAGGSGVNFTNADGSGGGGADGGAAGGQDVGSGGGIGGAGANGGGSGGTGGNNTVGNVGGNGTEYDASHGSGGGGGGGWGGAGGPYTGGNGGLYGGGGGGGKNAAGTGGSGLIRITY